MCDVMWCDVMWCDAMWCILFQLSIYPRHRPVVDLSLVRPSCHSFQAIGLNPQYQVVIKESPWLSSSAFFLSCDMAPLAVVRSGNIFSYECRRLALHIPNGTASKVHRHYSHIFIHSRTWIHLNQLGKNYQAILVLPFSFPRQYWSRTL